MPRTPEEDEMKPLEEEKKKPKKSVPKIDTKNT